MNYKKVQRSWGLHNWQEKVLLGVLSFKIRFHPHRQMEKKQTKKQHPGKIQDLGFSSQFQHDSSLQCFLKRTNGSLLLCNLITTSDILHSLLLESHQATLMLSLPKHSMPEVKREMIWGCRELREQLNLSPTPVTPGWSKGALNPLLSSFLLVFFLFLRKPLSLALGKLRLMAAFSGT